MIRFIAVALGGALGAMMRYGISQVMNSLFEGPAPVATWTVNLLGCLLIGFLVPFLTGLSVSMPVQLFVLVGFLGSLTTFSTFSMESVVLWEDGRIALFTLNAVASVAAGILLVWVGMKAHEWLIHTSG